MTRIFSILILALTPLAASTAIAAEFRISHAGPDGSTSYLAQEPSVAYDPSRDDYFVAWAGSDDFGSHVSGEQDVYGRFINGGVRPEYETLVSEVIISGNPDYDAFAPDVAFSVTSDIFAIAYYADDVSAGGDEEFEIFLGFVDAETRSILPRIQISDVTGNGTAATATYGVFPAIAWNSTHDEFLVVWYANDYGASGNLLEVGSFEIFGRRIHAATRTPVGDPFLISDMGVDDPDYDAFFPDVAYNSVSDRYAVVWEGDTDSPEGQEDDEFEIWARQVWGDPIDGTVDGATVLVSSQSSTNAAYDQQTPAIAFDATREQFLIAWSGARFESLNLQLPDEFEILTRLLDGNLSPISSTLQLSSNGPTINGADYDAFAPRVAFDPVSDEYFVVWEADDDGKLAPGNADQEYEVYGMRLRGSDGTKLEAPEMALSQAGPPAELGWDALEPSVAADPVNGELFAVWRANVSQAFNSPREYEIYGKRIQPGAIFRDGFERLGVAPWSAVVGD